MSLPRWCYPESSYLAENAASVEDGELLLHPSAVLFLNSLNLSWIHPHCSIADDEYVLLGQKTNIASQFSKYEYDVNKLPALLFTLYKQVVPALVAMSELWVRLLAFYVTPFCVCYLIHLEVVVAVAVATKSPTSQRSSRATKFSLFVSLAGLISAAILLTDPLYVHEFGRSFGSLMFGAMSLLTIRQIIVMYAKKSRSETESDSKSNEETGAVMGKSPILYWWYVLGLITVIYHVAFHLVLHPEETLPDIPQYEPGLYYDKSNQIMKDIVKRWPQNLRTYDKNVQTPWTITGDSRTGIPFLVNSIPEQRYHRVWVPSSLDADVKDEGEANALDIAFPPNGRFNKVKPFYVILHGLNGGSNEEYVKEFVMHQTQRGSTVAVMIARGLMGTPVIGKQVFHGARVSDISQVAKVIKEQLGDGTVLVGVGYSMGAIIMSNYVARSGASCHLDAAVAVSGGLDMREQFSFHRSMRLWQPMLAQGLRETVMLGTRQKYEECLTEEQFLELMRASHITAIDEHAVVNYNGFDNVMHYYSEMSAMGDYLSKESAGRIANVSIPFCVIHALDDPLISWRAAVSHQPEAVVNSGKGYLMLLLTKSGGHVGWPVGINPKKNGWEWMHGAVAGFVDAYAHVSKTKLLK